MTIKEDFSMNFTIFFVNIAWMRCLYHITAVTREIIEETHAGSYVDQFDDPVRFVEIEEERKKKEREWTEYLISKREGF